MTLTSSHPSSLQAQSLMDLLSYCRIKPVVNQVELHPYLTQAELLEYSQIANIHLTAFSPLGSSSYIVFNMDYGRGTGALDEQLINEIATKYSRTPAQILLRWSIQRGVSVIPKSTKVERIVENMNIFNFELSSEEMDRIASLNCNLRFNNPGVFCKFMGGAIPIFG
jgi:D-xylose reductase